MNAHAEELREQARRIAVDVLRRRRAGEPLTDGAVLNKHPELAAVLAEELRRVSLVQRAADEAFTGPNLPRQSPGAPKPVGDLNKTRVMPTFEMPLAEPEAEDADRGEDIRMTVLESAPHGVATTADPEPTEQAEVQAGALENLASPTSAQSAAALISDASRPAPQTPQGPSPTTHEGVARFRPVHRPATPLLRVLDDKQANAELIRIRQTSFVLGSRHGDLVIGHDPGIDPVHAEICLDPARRQWQLRDLNSRSGTYVRIQRIRLRPDDVVMIGRQRFRFAADGPQMQHPRLKWLSEHGRPTDVHPIELTHGPCTIGSGPASDLQVHDDLVDARHALVRFDAAQERWLLEDLQSFNGLWAAIRRVHLVADSIFQLGEQRFIFSLS